MRRLVFIGFMCSVLSIHASESGTIYHCPNLLDVKYERGYFSADTNYNGLLIHWESWKSFPEKYLIVKDNTLAVREDCIGGVCSVRCVYHANNSEMFFLEPSCCYKSEDVGLGNWSGRSDNYCTPMGSEDCQFYLN